MGRQAVPLLERGLKLDAQCADCLVNLATYYQEEVSNTKTLLLLSSHYSLQGSLVGDHPII